MSRKRSERSGGLSPFLYHHLQEARAAIAGIWFSPLTSLMTIAVIAISLAVPATFYVVLKNAELVSSHWQGGTQITLYLRQNLPDADSTALVARFKQQPGVAEVRYISPEQGLADFSRLSGFTDALSYLENNPLPPVIEVTPTAEQRTPEGAKALLATLSADPAVEQGKLDMQWLERLQGIISLLRHTIQGVAALLILGLVLTIANTLRLNIVSHRAEIEVMKLVGATNGFIYRPYLYLGMWFGLMGGLLAWWLCEVLLLWSEHQVRLLAELYDSPFRLQGLSAAETLYLLAASMLLGVLAAWFSVYRHIREIEPS